jgi:type VI secretion system VgrG family protein
MVRTEYPWFRLEAPALSGIDVQVRSVVGRERIAELYRFVIEVRVPGEVDIDLAALLRDRATLVFLRGDDELRRVHGAIVAASDRSEPDAKHATWELELGPRISDLALNRRLEVAVERGVRDIVSDKLTRAGFEADRDFAISFAGDYGTREFTVQYEESDLDFARRLTEYYGIAFTFVHEDGRDKVIFLDNNDAYPALDDVPYRARDSGGGVFRLSTAVRRLPSAYRVRDYNYRKPSLDVEGREAIVAGRGGEIYEFGANVTTSEQAHNVARVRAEAIRATSNILNGESDWMPLRAGAICTIDGHPRGPQRVLIVEVEHDAEVTALAEGTGEEHGYQNRFVAIPADVEYRPPMTTPRPRVSGMLTGMIEGGDGEYAHLDEHGRYRVRLLFDDSDTPEAHASLPIRMAQPHAGPGYGMHFPLRAGVEVLIACIDGDPDRPVIAGCVPNGETPSPVTTNNAAKNILRTGGGNEIAIDDTKGGHRIKLSSPHKDTVFQLGAPNAAEEGAITSTSGHITTVSKGATSMFSTVGFGLTLTHSAWTGNYVTLAEKNALEFAALVFEGLEATTEIVISALKFVRGLGDKERAAGENLYEQRKELADEKRKEADALAAEYASKPHPVPAPETATRAADDAPASRHGGKHGGRHPSRDPETHDEPEPPEEGPTAEEVEEAEAEAKKAEKERDDAKEALGYWEDNEKATGAMEAVAGGSAMVAKLFSVLAQIKAIHKSAEAVAKTGALAGIFNGLQLTTHQKTVLTPVPPYHISVGEGSAVLLGEKLAFVSGEHASVFGVESATISGAESTVMGAKLAEVHSPLKVALHASPVDSIEIEPGTIKAKSAIKTSITAPDIDVSGTFLIDVACDGKVAIGAKTVVAIAGDMECAMKTGTWTVKTTPTQASVGSTLFSLPGVIVDAQDGVSVRSGLVGTYEIDAAGQHVMKGQQITLCGPQRRGQSAQRRSQGRDGEHRRRPHRDQRDRAARLMSTLFEDQDFSRRSLAGADLHDARFVRCSLVDVDFTGANLEGADLTASQVRVTAIAGANLRGARFEKATFLRADLTTVRCERVSLIQCLMLEPNAAHVDFRGATLTRSTFRGASFEGAILEGVDAAQWNVAGGNLTGAVLARANLRMADLREATLDKCDLHEADLTDAALDRVVMRRASARSAKLHRARLPHADLRGTSFARAILTWADLSNADLSLAAMTGADLSFADLHRTKLDETDARTTGARRDNKERARAEDFTTKERT